MLGGAIKKSSSTAPVYVSRTEEVVVKSDGTLPLPKDHLSGATLTPEAIDADHPIRLINYGGGKKSDGTPSESAGTRTQIIYSTTEAARKMSEGCKVKFSNPAAGITEKEPAPGDHIRIFWTEKVVATDSAVEVVISPDTFPGTYKIVGDTFMRSEKTGKDEAFQFIINKAKVLSEVTITLEAEGDPSTFEMQLNVLRSTGDNGNEMMKLVRYSSGEAGGTTTGKDIGSISDGL